MIVTNYFWRQKVKRKISDKIARIFVARKILKIKYNKIIIKKKKYGEGRKRITRVIV